MTYVCYLVPGVKVFLEAILLQGELLIQVRFETIVDV